MLREAGHEVTDYDPMFAPDAAAMAAGAQYGFVTCTEVAEHFYRPAQEFDHMAGRYNLNPADPSARFRTLNLSSDILVSKFAFKCNLHRYSSATPPRRRSPRRFLYRCRACASSATRCRWPGWGSYKLNAVDPSRLKAPGFNP